MKHKKIILLIVLNAHFFLCKSQTSSDSCSRIGIESSYSTNLDSIIQEEGSLKKVKTFDTTSHLSISDTTEFNKKIPQNMQDNKEKFFNKKRIIILTSLVALQVAFGFDPKFTAINLIWLLF